MKSKYLTFKFPFFFTDIKVVVFLLKAICCRNASHIFTHYIKRQTFAVLYHHRQKTTHFVVNRPNVFNFFRPAKHPVQKWTGEYQLSGNNGEREAVHHSVMTLWPPAPLLLQKQSRRLKTWTLLDVQESSNHHDRFISQMVEIKHTKGKFLRILSNFVANVFYCVSLGSHKRHESDTTRYSGSVSV